MNAVLSADRIAEIIGKNLSDATMEELEIIQAQCAKQISQHQETEINDLVSQIAEKASKFGYDATNIIAKIRAKMSKTKTKATAKPKTEPVAKYRHPDDSSKTWHGKGPHPQWVKDWLQADEARKIDDLEIAA